MAYNSDGTKTALFLDLSLQNPDNNGTALTLIRSTAEPSLSLVKDVNTIPNGIAMNPTGLAYDNGTTITSTSWDDLSTRIAQLSAVAPNGLNATLLAVNQTISVQNADTAPTRVINTSAGDTAVFGEHFGVAWVGNTLPFVMETLDATTLQIKDTTLELNDSITPLLTTMTASTLTSGASSASWANIIVGAGGGVPSIDQVLFVGQNANNLPITNLNGIGIAGGTNLYNNSLAFVSSAGAITDLATINGVAYPPIGTQDLNSVLAIGNNANNQSITGLVNVDLSTINNSPYPPTYATPDLNNVLATGNSANNQSITSVNDISLYSINGTPYPPYPFAPYGLTDTLNYSNNAGGLSMTNINNIDLSTINGSPYPPSSSPDLQSVLGIGNSAGSYNINMNSQNIETANDVGLVSINGIPYLPAKFSAVFPSFDVGIVSNNSTSYGGSGVVIPVGNYQITYTIQLDGNITQGGGQYTMCRGYCYIQGASVGTFSPFMVNNGFMPSQVISYSVGSGYYNCLTATDYISVSSQDTFQLGVYQSNEQSQQTASCYISAIFQAV